MTSRTRASSLPTFVQVTRVPASIVSENGLNEPPPPEIVTLRVATTLQLGCPPGLGDGEGVCATVSVAKTLRNIALSAKIAARRECVRFATRAFGGRSVRAAWLSVRIVIIVLESLGSTDIQSAAAIVEQRDIRRHSAKVTRLLRRPGGIKIVRRTAGVVYSSLSSRDTTSVSRGFRHQPTLIMRHTRLAEIIRDTDIVCAIRPVVLQRHLTRTQTTEALIALQVPRAAEIATLVTTP